ncbi:hypothetical protein A5775_03480 [Mycobacterium sp. 852002-10029_SCH5224772]|nr:hypothetical protein A5775_03480 [Mycobacterium sp. 852002-10029_SCH5224772]
MRLRSRGGRRKCVVLYNFEAGWTLVSIGKSSSSTRFSTAAGGDAVEQLLIRLRFALRQYNFRRRL